MKLKLKECPRCGFMAYEKIKRHGRETSYGVCHDCNYNTVEFDEEEKHPNRDVCFQRSPALDPLDRMNEIINTLEPVRPFFGKTSLSVLRKAIKELPSSYQCILFLKYWKGLPDMSIAYYLNMRCRAVEKTYEQAYLVLRSICSKIEENSKVEKSPLPVAA